MDQKSLEHVASKGIGLLRSDLKKEIDRLEKSVNYIAGEIFREYARLIATKQIDDSPAREQWQISTEAKLAELKENLQNAKSDLKYHQAILAKTDGMKSEDFADAEKYLGSLRTSQGG